MKESDGHRPPLQSSSSLPLLTASTFFSLYTDNGQLSFPTFRPSDLPTFRQLFFLTDNGQQTTDNSSSFLPSTRQPPALTELGYMTLLCAFFFVLLLLLLFLFDIRLCNLVTFGLLRDFFRDITHGHDF